jgi:hypothetical protein
MTTANRPRTGRVVTLVLAAAAAVAATVFTGSAGQAAVVKPLPAALSGYPLAKQFTGADIAGKAWDAPANDPGGCQPNPAQISLTKAGGAELRTSGAAGNCVEAQSPHTYPTAPGYVYEVSLYDSSFKDWGGYWSYADNWPAGGELDAVESTQGQSYVSYHYTGNATVSTNPWQRGLTAVSKNITTGWHVIDVAYFSKKIEVFYDGHLYTTIAGSYVTGAPAWIAFGDGSCQSATYSVCASAADIGVAGNVQVKYLRIFKK